jgi:hypothetical protein
MRRAQVWALTLARVLYGSTLLLAPDRVVDELTHGRVDRTARISARVLGVRLLLQAVVVDPRSAPRRL